MRHRLIPIEERRLMHREYYMRAAIVSVWALAVAVTVGAAALFPASIRARAADKAALIAVSVAQNSNDASELGKAEAQLSQGNALLTALIADAAYVRFSGVVRAIVDIRAPVQVSSIKLNRQGTSTLEVTVQGVAPTRDSLLAFKARLEALSPGSKVDLPLSTLAKNTNVSFSLRLNAKLQAQTQ